MSCMLRVPPDVAELACMEFGRTVERELGGKGGLHLVVLLQPCSLPQESNLNGSRWC